MQRDLERKQADGIMDKLLEDEEFWRGVEGEDGARAMMSLASSVLASRSYSGARASGSAASSSAHLIDWGNVAGESNPQRGSPSALQ